MKNKIYSIKLHFDDESGELIAKDIDHLEIELEHGRTFRIQLLEHSINLFEGSTCLFDGDSEIEDAVFHLGSPEYLLGRPIIETGGSDLPDGVVTLGQLIDLEEEQGDI